MKRIQGYKEHRYVILIGAIYAPIGTYLNIIGVSAQISTVFPESKTVGAVIYGQSNIKPVKISPRLDVWALSLSCIIGWGAFVMPGTTFLPVAGPAGTAAAFVISTLIMGVIGVNYTYLMVRNPGIGGVYAYTKKAFGKGHAFLSA